MASTSSAWSPATSPASSPPCSTAPAKTQQTLALTVLARAVTHQPHLADVLRELLTATRRPSGPGRHRRVAAADPQPVLDALRVAVRATADPGQLHPLHEALPPRSLLLAPFSAELASRLVELYRPLADQRPDAFLPDLADALNNHSIVLAELGRRELALDVIGEAVAVYRQLAAARPDAFLPNLASALNNHSIVLAELGRRESALDVIGEAVACTVSWPPRAPMRSCPTSRAR